MTEMLLALGALWLAAVVAVVLLAPYSDPCNALLMNPWVRRYGSLGLIPLGLSRVPRLRHHVLRRVRLALQNDGALAEWSSRYVCPSEDARAENLARRLLQDRWICVQGPPGIGKSSYLKHLAAWFAGSERSSAGIKPVPLLLSFSEASGHRRLEAMACAALARLGQFSDAEFARWFLGQGDFVLLIDDLSDLNSADADAALACIEAWRLCGNQACVVYEGDAPENFARGSCLTLAPLDRESILRVLAWHLGHQRASLTVERFTDETFELCTLPHDLELLIELILRGEELPATRLELYQRCYDDVTEEWQRSGKGFLAEILYRRCYELEQEGDSLLTEVPSAQPTEIRDGLWERKLLLRRGQAYHLRHRLLRAYFAARFYASSWRELMAKSELPVDAGRRAMLEFSLLHFDSPQQADDLAFALFDRDRELATNLVDELGRIKPDLCGSWVSVFRRCYAAASLDQFLDELRAPGGVGATA